jgi:hypothetical protein
MWKNFHYDFYVLFEEHEKGMKYKNRLLSNKLRNKKFIAK